MAKAKKATAVVEEIELEEIEDDLVEYSTDVLEDEDSDSGEDMLSAKQAAAKLGTDGRTLRKFLRSQRGLVGQGNRWAISEDELPELKEKFSNWHKPKAPAEAKPKKAKAPKQIMEVIEDKVYDDDDEFEDLDGFDED